MRNLRITIKDDEANMDSYLSLEEKCGKVWSVVSFFGGKLDKKKIKALQDFSLAFGIELINI